MASPFVVPVAAADAEPPEGSTDRIVPIREKLALGCGDVAVQTSHNTLHVLAQPIFTITMGMSPALVSSTAFIQRIWDAFIDPLVGKFSDRFSSRWGRRRPLIFLGAFPMAGFFVLLWHFPAHISSTGLFWYFLLVSLLFYAGHSLVSVPLNCLKIEASTNYNERTRVAAFSQAFRLVFEIGTGWIFPLTQLAIFANPIVGLHWITAILGIAFFFAALTPAIVLRERIGNRAAERAKARASGWNSDFRALLGNKPFVQLLAIRGIANIAYYLVQIFGTYMNYYYIYHGNIRAAAVMQGWLGTSFQIASIGAVLLLRTISVKIGKRACLIVAAASLIAGGVAKLFIYDTGWPWMQLVVYVLNPFGISGIVLMTTSMVADVVDYAELTTGQRREGLHVAFLSWSDKVGNSVGTLLAGFILVWLGFQAKLGPQSLATLHGMKYTYAVIPALGAVVVMFLARSYKIDATYAKEMRRQLAQRETTSV